MSVLQQTTSWCVCCCCSQTLYFWCWRLILASPWGCKEHPPTPVPKFNSKLRLLYSSWESKSKPEMVIFTHSTTKILANFESLAVLLSIIYNVWPQRLSNGLRHLLIQLPIWVPGSNQTQHTFLKQKEVHATAQFTRVH